MSAVGISLTRSVQPKTLTVVASCAANGNTYPVGPTDGKQNVFDGNTTEVHWCPYEWQQVPGQPAFAAASYTLKIYDERGDGTPRKGGWLSPYSGTIFGMYLPQPYTPLAGESIALAFRLSSSADTRLEVRDVQRRNAPPWRARGTEHHDVVHHHDYQRVRRPSPLDAHFLDSSPTLSIPSLRTLSYTHLPVTDLCIDRTTS